MNSLKIFDVITVVVLLIGASVGGVISLLLPEITRGLILGFLVGLYADAVRLLVLTFNSYITSIICITLSYLHISYFTFIFHILIVHLWILRIRQLRHYHFR